MKNQPTKKELKILEEKGHRNEIEEESERNQRVVCSKSDTRLVQ